MTWQIRTARGDDSPRAAEVVRLVFLEYGFIWEPDAYHADLFDLQTHYLGRGDAFWVCETGEGAIVGTAGLRVFPTVPGSIGAMAIRDGVERAACADCSLERLYVHPQARRAGIGRALFEVTLAHARSIGCRAMEIWSDKEFDQAHRLYQAFGAEVIGERVHDDPDQAEEWGLILRV